MGNKGDLLQKEVETLRVVNNYQEIEIRRLQENLEGHIEEAVKLATAKLVDELNKAYMEISRLKAIINKDSSNSSKPSSTNGFKEIPNSREKSGKPQGGQKGHPGHRLQLPKNMEELERQGLVEKRIEDHTGGSSEYVSKFTIDVETKIIITEHRFAKGEVAEGLHNEVSYGDKIKAQVTLLMNEGIVPRKRLSEIINGMTHNAINLSTGTMSKIQSDFADQLTESRELDVIKRDLQNEEVMNTDDTPMKVLERIVYPEDEKSDEPVKFERAQKKSFRATIRTHSNETTTLYTVNPKKDKKGIERDAILPFYEGTLCHDHESKFFNYGKDNSGCGVHLVRTLKGLCDTYHCSWAGEMRQFMLGMNKYKNDDLDSGSVSCAPEKLESLESDYDRLIEQGREIHSQMKDNEWGRNELNAMLNRLANYKDNYMLFMRDYNVPFSNNLAERDLRSVKIKEKVSGPFRSWKGIEDHAKIRSFISTVKKRGINLFCAIKKVMNKEPVLAR